MPSRFDLATMDLPVRLISYGVLALVPALFVMGMIPGSTVVLWPTSGLMALVFLSIVLVARPTHFVLEEDALVVQFPVWSRRVPYGEMTDVERFEGARFRHEYGAGARVGAGGLFGTYGLWVTRKGTFEVYRSRVKDLVVVRCSGRRDLLLTPEDASGFVDALRRQLHGT